MDLAIIPLLVGFVGLFLIVYLFRTIKKESAGTPRMKEIAGYIQEGAYTFLKREFRTILYFIIVLAILLFLILGWQIAIGFVTGAFFSMLAILIGMSAAVRTNVRVAHAARTSSGKALVLAFRGGGIMGLSITSLVLIGISLLYFVFGAGPNNTEAVSLLVGFGFGASLSALFAQLGGGIFTKAADIGADLVGKVEVHIPEDDPRNPAVIADLVGDNVGDCAGRGADLFEASADNLVASMIIGLVFVGPPFNYGWNAVLFPLLIRSIGKIATIIGIFIVRKWENRSPLTSLNIGLFSTGTVALILFYIVSTWFMGDIRLFYCLTTGLVSIIVVSLIVQYYTGINRRPVKNIAEASHTGSAINVLTGLSYGLESAVFPMILIAGIMLFTYNVFGGGIYGIFGVVAATLGITEMKGIIMSIDTFGPIVDNAGGIAEMSGLSEDVKETLDALDAAGNVTKAITKGYALTKVVLTSVVLLFAYLFELARLRPDITLDNLSDIAQHLNIANPTIIAGFLIGATIPFLFSALTIRAVSNAAFKMIEEVRRQFKEIPGLLQGKAKPDYATCVDISTKYSLKQMVFPILVGLIAPIIVGFTLGVWPLVSFLLGVKIVGALLAIFMFNAGAAWDNAKKLIENEHSHKRTPALSGLTTQAAAVIGDTVGDPLKDTVGRARARITYTFTADINASIVIEKNNTVVDGAGYTVQGPGSGTGIDLHDRNNVTLQNIEVTNFELGIWLSSSSNNTITGNTASNINNGIWLSSSSNNTIIGNTASSNNELGIYLTHSSYNTITGNIASSNNNTGINLMGSSYNTVTGNIASSNNNTGINLFGSSYYNTIAGNTISSNSEYGIWIYSSSNNVFFHNNLIDNANNVEVSPANPNVLDNGVEGNYWSNYTGVDLNQDGIGDSWHEIYENNIDYYPLMGPFHNFNTPAGEYVSVVSNSTVTYFNYAEAKGWITIQVRNATTEQTSGFCRISIPHNLIDPEVTWINVVIDDGTVTPLYFNNTLYDNGTHRWIYVAYPHPYSLHEITIIPEFSSFVILPLFMTATLLAALVYRKNKLLNFRDFSQEMGKRFVPDRYIDIFQGRAPRNVLAKHYNPHGIEMLKEIYEKADLKVLVYEKEKSKN